MGRTRCLRCPTCHQERHRAQFIPGDTRCSACRASGSPAGAAAWLARIDPLATVGERQEAVARPAEVGQEEGEMPTGQYERTTAPCPGCGVPMTASGRLRHAGKCPGKAGATPESPTLAPRRPRHATTQRPRPPQAVPPADRPTTGRPAGQAPSNGSPCPCCDPRADEIVRVLVAEAVRAGMSLLVAVRHVQRCVEVGRQSAVPVTR